MDPWSVVGKHALIYGSSIFLMDKITGNQRNSHSLDCLHPVLHRAFQPHVQLGSSYSITLPGHRFRAIHQLWCGA